MFSPSTMPAETILKEKTEHLTAKRQYHSTRKRDNAPTKLRRHNVTLQPGQSRVESSSNLKGASGIDHKQLLAAAKSVHISKRLACDNPFWSEMEDVFAPVTPEGIDFLKKQMDLSVKCREWPSQTFVDENARRGLKEIEGASKKHGNDKAQGSVDSDPLFKGACSLSRFYEVPSLAQRLLSAVIDEDKVEDLYHKKEAPDHGSLDVMAIDPKNCNSVLTEIELGVDLQAPARGDFPVISKEDPGSKFSSKLSASCLASCSSQYQTLPLDDKIRMELQSIGLHPNPMPCPIDQYIAEHKLELEQQSRKKIKILSQFDEAIQRENQVEKRNVEQLAMDQFVMMAYNMANKGGNSSRKAANKVVEGKTKAFVHRTLVRCKEFESTGKSCFAEPGLKQALLSPPCEKDMKSAVSKLRRNFSGGCLKKTTRKSYPKDKAKRAASNAGKAASSGEVRTGQSSGSRACFKQHSSVASLKDDSSSSRVKRKKSQSPCCAPKATGIIKGKRSPRKRKRVENGSAPTRSTTGITPPSAECSRKKRSLQNKAKQKLDHLSASGSQLHEVSISADPAIDNLRKLLLSPLAKTVSHVPVVGSSIEKANPSDQAEVSIPNDVGGDDLMTSLNIDEDNLTESDNVGLAVPPDDLWDVMCCLYQ